MGQLDVSRNLNGEELLLEVSGHIDEDANFSQFDLNEGSTLVFDLDKVAAINSCGIREWIQWIKMAPEGKRIIYRHCPKIIVDQINMVAGFLPDSGEVESFYVPYYCDETDSEKMVLFSKGKEFNGSDIHPPESVKDDESGEEMEMDVIEAKYFKFLKKT